ncbi:protein MAIN-LIKE 1-like isoform X6 [Fagus crenata]
MASSSQRQWVSEEIDPQQSKVTRYASSVLKSEFGLLQDPVHHRSHEAKLGKADFCRTRGFYSTLIQWWKNIDSRVGEKVRAAGLGLFLDTLMRAGEGTVERKNLAIIKSLVERFWDTTNTFHLPQVGEMTMTPRDFSTITGLRMGGRRLLVDYDILSHPNTIQSALGSTFSLLGDCVRLASLYKLFANQHPSTNEELGHCVRAFMLYLCGSALMPNTGDTVSLSILPSLEDIDQLGSFDWGGVAYATLFHFVVQYSLCALKSLGGLIFAWEVWAYEYLDFGASDLRESQEDCFPRWI